MTLKSKRSKTRELKRKNRRLSRLTQFLKFSNHSEILLQNMRSVKRARKSEDSKESWTKWRGDSFKHGQQTLTCSKTMTWQHPQSSLESTALTGLWYFHMVQKTRYWRANCALGHEIKLSRFVLDVPTRNLLIRQQRSVFCTMCMLQIKGL